MTNPSWGISCGLRCGRFERLLAPRFGAGLRAGRAGADHCNGRLRFAFVLNPAALKGPIAQSRLPPSLLPLAAQAAAHASVGPTFEILPTRFGMVELDRLIVYQNREPELLQPDPTAVYQGFRAVTGMAGLLLGFRANVLNVVQVGRRMILNNGYHRAYALRALGIPHVPCVIQTAEHVDEVNLSVNKRVSEDVGFLLQSVRPPLVKDFFDPQIFKRLATCRRMRQLEIRIDIDDQIVHG